MKIVRTLAMFTALATSTLAFADTPPPKPADKPKAVEQVPAADVASWLVFFDKVVDTVVTDKDNCDKMSGDLESLFTANQALITTANAHKAKGLKLPKEAQDHMLEGVKKMKPGMKCMSNEKVKGAFAKFDGKDAKKH